MGRFDLLAIPPSRIKNSINQFLDQNNENSDKNFHLKFIILLEIILHLDYRWTKNFIEYDKKTRDEFINQINFKYFILFAPFVLFQIFKLIVMINKKFN